MAIIESIISGGAALGGAALNAGSAARMNKKQRQWAEYMYDKTRGHALEDWHRNNAYNSPANQMKLMAEGGINPAMYYGKGGSMAPAGSIRNADVQPVNYRTPEWGNMLSAGATSTLNAIYDLELKQAQVDNVRSQNTVNLENAALIAAQRGRSQFDLEFESDMRAINADARKEQLRQLKTSNTFQIDENERRMVTTAASVQEAMERVLTSRLQRAKTDEDIKNLKAIRSNIWKDVEIKKLDIELKKLGIQPGHGMWPQIIGRIIAGNVPEPALMDLKKGVGRAAKGTVRDVKSRTKKWWKKYQENFDNYPGGPSN